jgi:hypothetical protein
MPEAVDIPQFLESAPNNRGFLMQNARKLGPAWPENLAKEAGKNAENSLRGRGRVVG